MKGTLAIVAGSPEKRRNMQTTQMEPVWKLVGRVPGTVATKAQAGKNRKAKTPEKRYTAESGTLVVRTLTESEAARVLSLVEELNAEAAAAAERAKACGTRRSRSLHS